MKLLLFVVILCPIILQAASDDVTWGELGNHWRDLICKKESVIPLDGSRSVVLARKNESDILQKYKVRSIRSLSYQKTPPEPEVLFELVDALVLWGIAGARDLKRKSEYTRHFKELASAAFDVCSRVLKDHPETRCHPFLMVQIKPQAFFELLNSHFSEYSNSSIYLVDMKDQCHFYSSTDSFIVDTNCLPLAEEYFVANYLQKCLQGNFSPPQSQQFVQVIEE